MIDRKQRRPGEWADANKYSSFNSYKGLAYMDGHYVPTAAWLKGEGSLPAPIELSLDPAHLCNFKCGHCNAQRYLVINPDEVPEDRKIMTADHLKRIIDFTSSWGVRGVCIGGGGEPLMNRAVWKLPSYIATKKIDVPYVERAQDGALIVKTVKIPMMSSYATNGSIINEEIAEEMMNCRWVGVSIDSGTRETFEKVHGVDYFDKTVSNLRLLVKTRERTGSKIDISYKFLIRPDNWKDLESACALARDIGVQDFHARPVDLQRKDFKSAVELNYDLDAIKDSFLKCHDMADGMKFRVFTVMHKYDPEFRVQHTFKNCSSSTLMLQACADGNAYVCADHRLEPRFGLAAHFPNPEEILKFWGSDKHRKILKSIDPDKECGRCTYGEYARQIEETVQGTKGSDPMCLAFP
jgi:MoaA/NifB/PqqE/SkfB family radical SAM enzyme